MTTVVARIEWRSWYVDGKYLGNNSPWLPADRTALETERTGHFYGEYIGARFYDGKKELAADENRCIELHECDAYKAMPEFTHMPTPRGDWGEYRFITTVLQQ